MGLKVMHLDCGLKWRGGQRQVLYHLQGLKKLGWECELAAPAASPLSERAAADGFGVHGWRARSDLDLAAAWRLDRIVRQTAPDILHAHCARSLALANLAASFGRLPPFVATRRTAFRVRGGKLKYGRSPAGGFIAISRAIAGQIRAAGISDENISLIPSAAAQPDSIPPKSEAREVWGVGGDDFLICAAGGLDPSKGFDLLVTALGWAREVNPKIRAVIAGEGPQKAALLDLAEPLGEAVLFAGQLDDMTQLLAAADLFCAPSRQEGLGTAVIDAFLCGTPVLASNAGGLPDLVEDGKTGRLFPAGDGAALAAAIIRATRESGVDMADAARSMALKSFSPERMSLDVEELYRSVLKRV